VGGRFPLRGFGSSFDMAAPHLVVSR